MANFYLDTDVWIARLNESEENNKEATKLFDLIERGKHGLLISKVHRVETENIGFLAQFNALKDKLYSIGVCNGIKIEGEDRKSAENLNLKLDLGFGDCLHLVLAEKTGAIAVSYDAHWQKIGEVLGKRVFEPKEAIRQFLI